MVFGKRKSLNKALFTGPGLLNNLVDVLLQYRNHKIALVGDMEAIFHQVILTKCGSIYLEEQIHRAVQTLERSVLPEITKKNAVE